MPKPKIIPSQNETLQRGYRVNLAINVANLSITQFADLYQEVNKSSLYDWINGKTCLTKRGAIKIKEALQKQGYFCSEEWLLFGRGLPPAKLEEYKQGINSHFKSSAISAADQDKFILAELDFFVSLHENACSLLIEDQAMLPLLTPGDYVAGLKVDSSFWHSYYNWPCIIYADQLDPMVRYFNKSSEKNKYTLYGLHENDQDGLTISYDVTITSIAPVVWHRYNLSSLKDIALASGFLKTKKNYQ